MLPRQQFFGVVNKKYPVILKSSRINLRGGSSDITEQQQQEANSVIISFDYMKQFMKDVFATYGIPPDRCETCAEVLVEADRRGIHSHGLGRLKPIYCDRMDAGILKPSAPIDVVTESDCTALLDGNLGMGLYIAPYAMQMAIDKAKKHGVGFVTVRNSTHFGIAGCEWNLILCEVKRTLSVALSVLSLATPCSHYYF